MRRVHNAVALKLDPDAIHARTRKNEIELHFRLSIRNERVRVDHVDQVVAGRQHMTPGAEILFEAIAWVDGEPHSSGRTGERLIRADRKCDLQVLGGFW